MDMTVMSCVNIYVSLDSINRVTKYLIEINELIDF